MEVGGRVETIQTTAWLRTARILRRDPETWFVFLFVCWVLWHINLRRLSNAKSVFMKTVLFQKIQFTISTQFNCQKHFYFKLFKQLYITIQFSVSTVSMSKTLQFQRIQFSISTQFKCKYSLIVINISISSYSV